MTGEELIKIIQELGPEKEVVIFEPDYGFASPISSSIRINEKVEIELKIY